jgi:hypothetical protein
MVTSKVQYYCLNWPKCKLSHVCAKNVPVYGTNIENIKKCKDGKLNPKNTGLTKFEEKIVDKNMKKYKDVLTALSK